MSPNFFHNAGEMVIQILAFIIIISPFIALIVGARFIYRLFYKRCDCMTRVNHYAAGMTGLAGISYIPHRDCPKCHGTGTVDRRSPYARQPSPMRGLPPDQAGVLAGAAAGAATVGRPPHQWHREHELRCGGRDEFGRTESGGLE